MGIVKSAFMRSHARRGLSSSPLRRRCPSDRNIGRLYPGDLFRLDMRPDLGALNLLIAPFLPTMDAWFNPNDNWNYVGGEFDRYFRGPHVMTVRMPPAE